MIIWHILTHFPHRLINTSLHWSPEILATGPRLIAHCMSRGLWIHVLIDLEEAFWQPDLPWWANFEKVTLRWHGSWCYYRSWQKLWKSWNPLRSLHKHRAKEMLPFQAGKLPPLWYVKMGLWPQEETSLLATGAPEVIRLDL